MKRKYEHQLKKVGRFAGMAFTFILLMNGTIWAAPDHRIFGELLAKYNRDGQVDYAGFKSDESRLDEYLDGLSRTDPASLASADRFAFYVNVYNAWTIKLILSAYPGIDSIKELGNLFKSPWKRKLVALNGKRVTLDHIEHDILRPQFKDPRVHFAVNCASIGCPPLYPEPFTGSRLDQQLNAATKAFINDARYNRIEDNTLYVSKIFKWFREDFNHDIIAFFEQYASGELNTQIRDRRANLKIEFLDYDWGLNGF